MNATQLFNCDGATKSPPGSGAPPPGRPASPNLSAQGDKSNPATHVFIQGWMLMAVAVSIFVPRSSKLLWFLRNHFARNKDSKYVFIQKMQLATMQGFNLPFIFFSGAQCISCICVNVRIFFRKHGNLALIKEGKALFFFSK